MLHPEFSPKCTSHWFLNDYNNMTISAHNVLTPHCANGGNQYVVGKSSLPWQPGKIYTEKPWEKTQHNFVVNPAATDDLVPTAPDHQ